jgi:hypothetical protein
MLVTVLDRGPVRREKGGRLTGDRPAERARADAQAREALGLRISLTLSPRGIFRTQMAVILVLTLASLAVHVVALTTGHDNLFGLRALFDVNGEQNIPAMYSGGAMLLASLILLAVFFLNRQNKIRSSTFWPFLSFVFLFLSYDELFSVHEKLGPVMRGWMDVHGALYVGWVIPGAAFALAVFLSSIGFLRRLEPRTRALMVLSGAIYVAGAIGFEALGSWHDEAMGTEGMDYTYLALSACEELLEMFGIALFTYTLLRHIEVTFGVITCRLR